MLCMVEVVLQNERAPGGLRMTLPPNVSLHPAISVSDYGVASEHYTLPPPPALTRGPLLQSYHLQTTDVWPQIPVVARWSPHE